MVNFDNHLLMVRLKDNLKSLVNMNANIRKISSVPLRIVCNISAITPCCSYVQ